MEERTVYEMLYEAASIADVIVSAETGCISLNRDSIRELDKNLLQLIDKIRDTQKEKVASAATLATD